MNAAQRRAAAETTLAALEVVIEDRHAGVLALEDAQRELEARPHACDGAGPSSACSGAVSARWCRSCGKLARRCEGHGGIRRADQDAEQHAAKHELENVTPTGDVHPTKART